MSHFWSGYIILFVVANLIGCFALLLITSKHKKGSVPEEKTTGHEWDGITELNTPLPRWWLGLFYITLFFGIGYLALYPGLGNFSGLLGWTHDKEYQQRISEDTHKYADFIGKYAQQPIPELARNKLVMKTAQRIFANNCAACHGSDAKGAPGFPDLTDNDWLHGGTPEDIEYTIEYGRGGSMPSFDKILSDSDKDAVIAYLSELRGGSAYAEQSQKGRSLFTQNCVVCHGADGKGNQQMGSADLTDNIWLYGGSDEAIKATLTQGRQGKMPAHEKLLDAPTIHLLAAYVYSLSNK